MQPKQIKIRSLLRAYDRRLASVEQRVKIARELAKLTGTMERPVQAARDLTGIAPPKWKRQQALQKRRAREREQALHKRSERESLAEQPRRDSEWERQKREVQKRERDRELAKAYGTDPGPKRSLPKTKTKTPKTPVKSRPGRKLRKLLREYNKSLPGSPQRAKIAAELDRQASGNTKSVRAMPTAFETNRRKH